MAPIAGRRENQSELAFDGMASMLLVVAILSGKLALNSLLPGLAPGPLLEFRLWATIGALALLWPARATSDWRARLHPAALALGALIGLLLVRSLLATNERSGAIRADLAYMVAQAACVFLASRRQIVLAALWVMAFALAMFLLAAAGIAQPELNGPGWAPIGGPTTFYRLEFLACCLCWCFYDELGRKHWLLPVFAALFLYGTLASLSKIALPGTWLVLAAFAVYQGMRKKWQTVAWIIGTTLVVSITWHSAMKDDMQVRLDRVAIAPNANTPRVGTDFEVTVNYCIGANPPSTEVGCVKGAFVDRSSRLVFAAHALEGIAANPLWGQGLGTFELHMPNPKTGIGEVYRYPHNLLLEITLASGFVGLGLLLLALGLTFRASWLAAKRMPAGIYLVGFMVFIFLSTLVSGDFYDSRLVWLVAFALIGLARSRAPEQ